MLSKHALKEILQFVKESGGSFVILEKDEPRLAVLDFKVYQGLVEHGKSAVDFLPDTGGDYAVRQTILVTGGAGTIGGAVTRALHQLGCKLVVVDNLSRGNKANLPPGVEFIQADVGDEVALESVFNSHKFDAVFHLAETGGHKQSLLSPELYFINNVERGIGLLKLMLRHGVNKIIFRSSLPEPTPYAQTKILFENILNFYHQSFGINSLSLRLPKVCLEVNGGTDDPEALLFENPVAAVLLTAQGKISCLPLPFLGDLTPDGSPRVEVVSLEDAVSAFVFAFKHLESSSGCMIYGVDGIKTSIAEIIEESLDITQKMIPTMRSNDVGFWSGITEQPTKPLSQLGWQPKFKDIQTLIQKLWLLSKHKEQTTEQADVTSERSLRPAEEARTELRAPISLSELLSGKFTPFIKPHNS